jgi:mRNA interferase YafQ
MRFSVRFTSRFKKDRKRLISQGKRIDALDAIVEQLASGRTLPEACHDHALKGDKAGFRDCHIEPDWILLYRIDQDVLVLTLTRTGTHAELLGL